MSNSIYVDVRHTGIHLSRHRNHVKLLDSQIATHRRSADRSELLATTLAWCVMLLAPISISDAHREMNPNQNAVSDHSHCLVNPRCFAETLHDQQEPSKAGRKPLTPDRAAQWAGAGSLSYCPSEDMA